MLQDFPKQADITTGTVSSQIFIHLKSDLVTAKSGLVVRNQTR
jgi:hypothetical protein